MRICIVSRGGRPGDPNIFDPKEGAAVKLYYTMLALASLGHEVFYVCGENRGYYKVEEGEFRSIEFPEFFQKIFNYPDFFEEVVSRLGVPWEFSVLYHPAINLNLWFKTLYVTLKKEVDVLQAEFPAYGFPALFAKFFSGAKVSVVEHNVEYFQIQQIADDLCEGGRKMIKFVEKFVCTFSDYVVTVSEEDKDRLDELGIETSKVVPHGVDIERFQSGDGERVREKLGIEEDENVLIFHGVLSYKPNKEAVKAIVEKILPELRELDKKFKILVVGGSPPEIGEEEVITTGYVEKLEDYIDAADLAIVPLKAGGGTRLKILEYMASEIPIISTRKGVEGIEVEDGKKVIISDVEDFPKEINKLLGKEGLREDLKKNGFEFTQDYSWESIGKMYEELYR